MRPLVLCASLVLALPLVASHTTAPSAVTIGSSFQDELGCGGDWDADCAATHLTYDATDGVWQATFALPAGSWEYKAALNDAWDENYGANAAAAGGNISLPLAAGRAVKFYYSHSTHWITSNANVPIVTAVGSFQDQIGCTGEWQPECLRSWLQDPDGDGTYTFSTTAIPAGTYEAKATINEAWDENYGAGGAQNGANIGFTVPADGVEMMFSYVGSTHVLTITAKTGAHDDNIWWDDLRHDSRDSVYRTPGGAVSTGTEVTLRLRALAGDLTGAKVRVYDDRTNGDSLVPMTLAATEGSFDWWEATVAPGSDPTILWYRFIAEDGTASAYYEDDSARDGGTGETLGTSQDRSWQLTVYDPSFTTPDWAKNGIVYQIFPDRFRNGDPANDTVAGTFFYGEPGGTILRSGATDWNTTVCDPRDAGGPCPGKYSNNFYGGDLQGIRDKLSYLDDLGVTVLYLNPIFESPSNHKYDTSDFGAIDDNFGDLSLFRTVTSEAESLGMKVVLDGVFNHTSSDSRYFDRYGLFDDIGACESTSSTFRSWYFFHAAGAPGTGVCAGDTFYTSWFGYDSLPKLNSENPATRQLIWDDPNAIARYWLGEGADGWRLDVGGDVDPGLTNAPLNDYWEGFRSAVREEKSDAWIVGEEWGLAGPWTLGGEWDATMNYQFSSAVLGFWRDETFTDNDHEPGSSAGVLAPLTPSQLDARLHNLEERYPPQSFHAMMNLLGSHDTNRALFMLDHNTDANDPSIYQSSSYDWSDAIVRLKGAALLQMTLPGAPTIYYGDEVGLVGPVAYAGKWEDDPYNRQPYPWLDQSGTPFYPHLQSGGAGESLRTYYRLLTGTRNSHPALRTGSFDTLLVDDVNDVYAYGRKLADSSDAAVVLINRDDTGPQTITVDVSGYLAEGAQFEDVLGSGAVYTVTGGALTVPNVPARGGALLVLASPMSAPPDAVTDLAASVDGGTTVGLNWTAATGASSYDVYRSLLSGGGYTLEGNTATPSYSVTGLTPSVTYYFVVVSRNDTTGLTSASSNEVSATPFHDLGDSGTSWFNLQWPPSITHTISTTDRTDDIYGQIWVNGVTEAAGTPSGLRAQVGYGPDGTQPDDTWNWVEMTYNAQAGNNDEFVGSLLPDQTGSFDYATRYSADGGAQWWYADLSGPQRDGTLDNPGSLTVVASADSEAPAAPQGLAVVSTAPTAIALSWSANDEEDLAGYEVFRELLAAPGYTRVGSVPAGTTSFMDSTVTNGTSYRYSVKAYDTSFNRSGQSNAVEASAAYRMVDITFDVTVPAFTPADDVVYIVGSLDALGPWNPGLVAMTKVDATHWTHTMQVRDGTAFDYKFTRGSWDTVEKAADGIAEITRSLTATYGTDGTQSVNADPAQWRDPIVESHSPAAGATGVATSAVVSVVWTRQMQASNDFSVSSPGGSVAGTFAYDGATRTTTFTPADPLLQGTAYTIAVSGETSATGDLQQEAVSWTFTTACSVSTPTSTAEDNVAFCEGGSVTLTSSSTTGNQWYRNGSPIDGAMSSTYDAMTTGSYTVVVTVDACTTAPSNAIDVSVTSSEPVPTISAGGPTTFCHGSSVTLTSSNMTGNQWFRNGVPISGATARTFLATIAGSYTVAALGACPSAPSTPVEVSVDPLPPPPTISATGPVTFCSGGSVTLTSSNASGNQWYRNGIAISGGTGQTLLATLPGYYTATSSSGGCISEPSERIGVTVNPRPNATIAVDPAIHAGASSTASVDVACAGATFSWSISGGTITAGQGTPRVTYTAGAPGTLALTVTVTNTYGCTDTRTVYLRVTLAPFGAPPGVQATASGDSAVVQWAAVRSADHYEVFRSVDNVAWTSRGTTSTTTFTDVGLMSETVYLYRVKAVKTDTTQSAPSAASFATTTIFSDAALCPAVIRASHLLELRDAINAVRASVGLSAASFTDPVLSGATIQAVHLAELRAALTPALAAIGVTPEYTDPTLSNTMPVKAAHVYELREWIQ